MDTPEAILARFKAKRDDAIRRNPNWPEIEVAIMHAKMLVEDMQRPRRIAEFEAWAAERKRKLAIWVETGVWPES